MFNFTPLLGAQSASPASQSLLEFDGGIKVLIDAGWDESFDVEKLKQIEKYVLGASMFEGSLVPLCAAASDCQGSKIAVLNIYITSILLFL